ncbi:MAG: dimethylsulfonioproprionate lyase family protein [Pseudomonadota bacterium]
MSGAEHLRTTFNNLLSELASWFGREGRSGGGLAAEALKRADTDTYRRCRSEADPGALLDQASALPGALAPAQHVLACRALLDWTCWSGGGLGDGVSARLFTTELVGPDGHIPADDVRVGLLVSAPHTDYPLSSHSGEETYLVISGEAEWIVGDEDYRPRPPGALVHHPAWMPHGRRTLNEPFLGAWRWSGDLNLGSFKVEDNG